MNVSALKILFLERSLGRGGAQRQLVALATGLARRGHDITVALFYNEGPFKDDLLQAGVDVHILGKKHRWDVHGFLRNAARLVRARNPDAVCTFLPVPNLIAAICKLARRRMRLVWGIRASNMDLKRYDLLTRFSYWIEPFGSRLANIIVANSSAGRKVAIAKGFSQDKIVIIPNGIDTFRFVFDPIGRQRLRSEWGVADSEILVGLIARLDPMKDHRSFVSAAARVSEQISDIRFVCVGDEGPIALEDLMREADCLAIGHRMIWASGRADMPAVYSACDLVCSSSAYGEGFSNTLAEAMSCGLRCVATDVGDARDILDQSCKLVAPSDPVSLAQGIAELAAEVKKNGSSSPSSRAHIVTNFSMDAMVSAFETLFRHLMGQACRH